MRSITALHAQWNAGVFNSSTADLARIISQATRPIENGSTASSSAPPALPLPTPAPAAKSAAIPSAKPMVGPSQEPKASTQHSHASSKQSDTERPAVLSPPPKEALPQPRSPPLPPAAAPAPTDASSPPEPAVVPAARKVSRRKKASMNNVHHMSNYVPRQRDAAPAHGSGNGTISGTADVNGIPAGCLDHPSTSNPLFPDEWVCLFCDYELLYGEPPLMIRAIRNRKKLAATRRRAQARAHRAATGKAPLPPRHTPSSGHNHAPHQSSAGSDNSATPRCECGNPLCYEDPSPNSPDGTPPDLAPLRDD